MHIIGVGLGIFFVAAAYVGLNLLVAAFFVKGLALVFPLKIAMAVVFLVLVMALTKIKIPLRDQNGEWQYLDFYVFPGNKVLKTAVISVVSLSLIYGLAGRERVYSWIGINSKIQSENALKGRIYSIKEGKFYLDEGGAKEVSAAELSKLGQEGLKKGLYLNEKSADLDKEPLLKFRLGDMVNGPVYWVPISQVGELVESPAKFLALPKFEGNLRLLPDGKKQLSWSAEEVERFNEHRESPGRGFWRLDGDFPPNSTVEFQEDWVVLTHGSVPGETKLHLHVNGVEFYEKEGVLHNLRVPKGTKMKTRANGQLRICLTVVGGGELRFASPLILKQI